MKISESGLNFTLIKVKPGYERDLRSLLVEETPDGDLPLFFKILGSYDLAVASEIRSPDPYGLKRFQPHSLSATSFWLFSDADPDVSKSIEWMRDAELLALSFLKAYISLDADPSPRWVFSLAKTVKDICTVENVPFSIHFTLGHREIALLLKTDSIETVFGILRTVRKQKCASPESSIATPSFSETYTIPLVSYPNIIDKNAYDRIKGSATPFLQVTSLPGADAFIRSQVAGQSILGTYDFVSAFDENRKLGDIIKTVVELRDNWRGKIGLVDTSSAIIYSDGSELGVTPKPDELEPADELGTTARSIIDQTEEDLALIAQISEHRDANRDLMATMNDLLIQLNLSWNDPRFARSFMILRPGIEFLRMIADDYFDMLGIDIQKARNKEGVLGVVVENLYFVLNQMRFGVETNVQAAPSRGTLCMTGISQVLVAASNLCQFLYGRIKANGVGSDWLGFPMFRRTYGYRNLVGEVKSFPDEALFFPCLPGTNWATISHEISHSCYDRKKMLDALSARIKQVIEDQVREYNPKDPQRIKAIINVPFRSMIEELFAHWFDFRHFYFEQTEFYLWAIWNTWLELPIIQHKLDDYLVRSLSIYSLGNLNRIAQCEDKGKEHLIGFLSEQLEELLGFLNREVPMINKRANFNQISKRDVAIAYGRLFPVMSEFEERHKNDALKNDLNQDYDELPNHIDQIWQGIVIEETIPNPWRLLLGCLQKAKQEGAIHGSIGLPVPLAFILSLYGSPPDRRHIEIFGT